MTWRRAGRGLSVAVLSAILLTGLWFGVGHALASKPHATGIGAGAAPSYTNNESGGLTAQPVLGFPGTSATMIGASTNDSKNPYEVWAEGDLGNAWAPTSANPTTANSEALVQLTSPTGNWQMVPVQDSNGKLWATGWSTSEVTPDGGVVLAGIQAPTDNGSTQPDPEQILVREADPTTPAGEAFTALPSTGLSGASLSTTPPSSSPIIATDDESGGVGVFVAPTSEPTSGTQSIYHYDSGAATPTWVGEPVCATYTSGATCATPPSGQLQVDAISVSASNNAWMLATPAGGTETASSLQLYEREPETGSGASTTQDVWVQQPLASGTGGPISPLFAAGSGFGLPAAGTSPATNSGAILTASGSGGAGSGVWLDLESTSGSGSGSGSATIFIANTTTPNAATVAGTWCSSELLAGGSNANPACAGANVQQLPADLQPGYGSIVTAQASATSLGGRVITGLQYGATMVLAPGSSASSSFQYQITSGGEQESSASPPLPTPDNGGGNTYGPGGETLAPDLEQQTPQPSTAPLGGGAAFTSPTDGWIGIGGPTPGPEVAHITNQPAVSSFVSWPTPAQSPLLAIAGQPGTDAASGTGQALAVGADGEVERYTPNEGWSQEPLVLPGQTTTTTSTTTTSTTAAPTGVTGVTGSSGTGAPPAPAVSTATMRGVAWPTSQYAYAVGDKGSMWRWQSATGTWTPDPGAPANEANDLTGIAFDPNNPAVGYVVGKNGTVLSFGPGGVWQKSTVGGTLANADFSSVTFAGDEPIAAYRLPGSGASGETGGLATFTGGSWQPIPSLPGSSAGSGPLLTAVSGLPNGGAVAAGPGIVIETNNASDSSSWALTPMPLGELSGGAVSALAAYTDSNGNTAAIVSVDPDPTEDPGATGNAWQAADTASAIQPDPLPNQGFVVTQTPSGWVDNEDEDFPGINEPPVNVKNVDAGTAAYMSGLDQPGWPEGVYALLVNASGTSGWAVGGQTGGTSAAVLSPATPNTTPLEQQTYQAAQDGAAFRFGAGGPTPPTGTGPVIPNYTTNDTGGGEEPLQYPVFAFVGGSGCNAPCAGDAQELLGPDQDLAQSIAEVDQATGIRGLFDVGHQINFAEGTADGTPAYTRELQQFSDVLSSGNNSDLPVYAVPNGPYPNQTAQTQVGDIQSSADESIYNSVLGPHDPASNAPITPTSDGGLGDAYTFDSSGPGQTVRVIVLDFSQGNTLGSTQENWLASELSSAQTAGDATLVIGSDNITNSKADNYANDASTVQNILIQNDASAYVYDSDKPGNLFGQIGPNGGNRVATVGIYSLGDNTVQNGNTGNTGNSGTGSTGGNPGPTPKDNSVDPGFLALGFFHDPKAPAGEQNLVGSFGEIANAGQTAFVAGSSYTVAAGQTLALDGLARPEQAGAAGVGTRLSSTQLPQDGCAGYECLAYTSASFSTSNPSVGEFVIAGRNPNVPFLNPKNKEIIPSGFDGLFCALSPGTTTVKFNVGGVTYSEPITVTAGTGTDVCPNTAAAATTTTATTTQPQPPPPVHKPVHQHHAPRPVHHHRHHAPARHHHRPSPARGVHPHHRPAPVLPPVHAPSPSPSPGKAPVAPAPKSPPLSGVAPARPVPPTGFTGAPTPAGGVVPVSSPAAVPFNVVALERKTSAEAAFEESRQQFAAYHPAQHSLLVVPIALLVLALAGGGASGTAMVLRRRRGVAWGWLVSERSRRWR